MPARSRRTKSGRISWLSFGVWSARRSPEKRPVGARRGHKKGQFALCRLLAIWVAAPGRLRLEEVNPLKVIRPLAHLPFLLFLVMTIMGLEAEEQRYDIRHDTHGDPGINVGHWIGIVIAAVVLLIVLAALFPTLQNSLASYAANDTSGFGAILVILVPVLIGVAVLLAFVYAFLPKSKGIGR